LFACSSYYTFEDQIALNMDLEELAMMTRTRVETVEEPANLGFKH
jgi:hypothetical protein